MAVSRYTRGRNLYSILRQRDRTIEMILNNGWNTALEYCLGYNNETTSGFGCCTSHIRYLVVLFNVIKNSNGFRDVMHHGRWGRGVATDL
jgi:hypothetical protein